MITVDVESERKKLFVHSDTINVSMPLRMSGMRHVDIYFNHLIRVSRRKTTNNYLLRLTRRLVSPIRNRVCNYR